MDGQDHTTTAITAGHVGNGVHLCHRCGWPFPNPHPSSRHRRAHKKVCGTVEGYKIFTSEEQDRHLASLDDEHASDEDAHTPSPDLVKKKAEGSGKVGEKSNRSEDVYSDAVTDFPDSGVSPKLEEQFESVREVGKCREQKGVEGDQAADRAEQSNDPKTNEEITNPGPLVNGANLSEGVIAVTDTSDEAVPGQDADIEVQDDHLDSEEGKLADCKLTAVERQEESCDKLVSEVVKHDLPPQTGTLQDLDASEGSNNGAHSIETVKVALVDEVHENEDDSVGLKEVSPLTEEIRPVGTSELALVDETHEKKVDSVGFKEVSHSTEVLRPAVTVGEDTSPQQSLDAPDPSLLVSSIDEEVKSKTSLDENVGGVIAREGEKCEMNGKEKRILESKESFYFDSVPSFSITYVPEDDQSTSAFKTDVDHSEEKSDSEHLDPGNEKSEGGSVEEHVIPDSTMISDKAADFPSSCAEDSDARNIEELSKYENRPVESGRIGSELNRDGNGDVSDKNSSLTASLEDPIISEIPNNIQVIENVDRVESVDVVDNESKLTDNNEIGSSEKTPQQTIRKESTPLSTESELLSENSGNDNGCTKDGAKASESTDTTEETVKLDHGVNLASSGAISESKCVDLTSGVNESNSSKDFSPMKSISSAELDGNFLVSEIHLGTLSSKEAAPPPSDYLTSGTGDDNKTIVNVVGVGSKSLQAEVDDKLTKENDGSSSDRADSMDANCGSVISDTLETNSQKLKTTTEEAQPEKPDTFEPPSFMTLVQPGGEGNQVKGPTEIETAQNNQQPKSDALQAGWFPSLTNVVNESEGRKKNEEVIAKVTNWSPGKQHHSPLKTLLTEVKSPNTKQVGSETKDDNGGTTAAKKDQDTNKDVEEWNSPARYPIEIKKEKKKKGRSYWVPFVCCSSVHRDL